jgi:hypothetical protein
MFKLYGAQFIARGKHELFIGFFVVLSLFCTTLGVAVSITGYQNHGMIAYQFGESACVFASVEGCAASYASIFMGPDGLGAVFEIFGPTVALQVVKDLRRYV